MLYTVNIIISSWKGKFKNDNILHYIVYKMNNTSEDNYRKKW